MKIKHLLANILVVFILYTLLSFNNTASFARNSNKFYNQKKYAAQSDSFISDTLDNGRLKATIPPTADFSVSTTGGCAPLQVNFQESATAGDYPIVTYRWDFGDGNSAEGQDVSHTYQNPGDYYVSLRVIDEFGNYDIIVRNNLIHVSAKPTVNYSADRFGCDAQHTTTFTDLSFSSSGDAIVAWEWDFGDGSSSDLQNPSHNYIGLGFYDVKLTVTDENNCSNTNTSNDYIRLYDVQSSFTVADTVCLLGSVNFTNNSTVSAGAISYNWDFGNGNSSTIENPTGIKYANRGDFTVNLTVRADGQCPDDYSQDIYVEQPDAIFSTDTNWSCTFPAPLTVNFTDASSSNVTEWDWNFGGGNTSTDQNPSFDFTSQTLVNLQVSTVHGCTNSATTFIEERSPDVIFESDTSQGCIPLEVTFTDNSNPLFTFTDWAYDFGEGGNSTDQNPVYQYDTGGIFYAKLTVTDSICGDYTDSIRITPGDTIKADFIAPDSACAVDEVAFFDDSDTTISDEWYWDFGDSTNSTEQNPTHTYFNGDDFTIPLCEQDTSGITKPKIFDVMFVATDNGCRDTITKPLTINGPAAFIQNVYYDCDSSLVYYFVSWVYDADKIKWDFGDGTADSIIYGSRGEYLDTIRHVYNQGSYNNITLTAFNTVSGCEQSVDFNNCFCERDCASSLCVLDSVTAEFTVDTTKLCFDQALHLDATASHNALEYYWYLINQDNDTSRIGTWFPQNDSIITHTINEGGIYSVLLRTVGCNQCTDTYTINNILSIQPYVNFTVDDSIGCKPFTVQFDTLYQEQDMDTTITSWIWQYGDGEQDTFINYTQPSHTYIDKGYFSPTLIITDTAGCVHSKTKVNFIYSSKPEPIFSVTDRTICEKSPANFNNFTSGINNTYLWEFGDGESSTSYSPNHSYDTAGIYITSLTATDTIGCDSTIFDNDSIFVQALPIAEFTSDSVVFPCYPSQVKFFFDSTLPGNENVVNWKWDVGTGNIEGIKNPITTYGAPDDYDVQLIVETNSDYNCTDTITKNSFVEVGGPYFEFSVSTQAACKREPITFTYDTVFNIEWIVWHYDNQQISDTIIPPTPNTPPDPFTYAYQNSGNYYIEAVYKDSAACTQTAYIDKFGLEAIRIHQLTADFELEDTACSAPSEVQFINTSVNADTFYWDFDDASTIDTSKNPSHTYNVTGKYMVQLITKSTDNCYDTIIKTVNVHPLPIIYVQHDTIICKGDKATINAIDTNVYTYNWTPNTSINDSDVPNPVVNPQETTEYILAITDVTTCQNTDSLTVYVQQPPEVIFAYENKDGDTIWSENDTLFLPLGDTISPLAVTEQENVSLVWSEGSGPQPTLIPVNTTSYSVTATDSMQCFDVVAYLVVNVSEGTVDLPTAFTPNNDGYNDIIKVNGWGIKELLQFQVYNRWGQLLFETTNINEGWDGTFNGKPQNIDTYIYSVKVETLRGNVLTKSGSFSLMR